MKTNNQNIMLDALKAIRKQNREEEIKAYGHPICHFKVFKSKKIYSRKNLRVDFSYILGYIFIFKYKMKVSIY